MNRKVVMISALVVEILFTRARISAWVIVDQNNPCGRFDEGLPKDISGMDNARLECSF